MYIIQQCTKCGVEKNMNDFYKQKRHTKKRGEFIYINQECKSCTKQRNNEWANNNKDKVSQSKQKHYELNKDKMLKKARSSSKKRRENGEYDKWLKNNPDKMKTYAYQRKQKNHQISKFEWEQCKEYFNNSCAYCGTTLEQHRETFNQDLHKEHVIYDGANDLSNCVPSCKLCNSQKWEYEFEEWYAKHKRYSKGRYNKIIQWLTSDYAPIQEEYGNFQI